MFQVGAGTTTIYLIGRTGLASWDVGARQLVLMYFPTAYGETQTSNLQPPMLAP